MNRSLASSSSSLQASDILSEQVKDSSDILRIEKMILESSSRKERTPIVGLVSDPQSPVILKHSNYKNHHHQQQQIQKDGNWSSSKKTGVTLVVKKKLEAPSTPSIGIGSSVLNPQRKRHLVVNSVTLNRQPSKKKNYHSGSSETLDFHYGEECCSDQCAEVQPCKKQKSSAEHSDCEEVEIGNGSAKTAKTSLVVGSDGDFLASVIKQTLKYDDNEENEDDEENFDQENFDPNSRLKSNHLKGNSKSMMQASKINPATSLESPPKKDVTECADDVFSPLPNSATEIFETNAEWKELNDLVRKIAGKVDEAFGSQGEADLSLACDDEALPSDEIFTVHGSSSANSEGNNDQEGDDQSSSHYESCRGADETIHEVDEEDDEEDEDLMILQNGNPLDPDEEPAIDIDETRSISILSTLQRRSCVSRASSSIQLEARPESAMFFADMKGEYFNDDQSLEDPFDDNEWRIEERKAIPQKPSLASPVEPHWYQGLCKFGSEIIQDCKVPSLVALYDLNLIRDENMAQALYYEHCIWKFCLRQEKTYLPNPNYFSQHPDLNYQMRYILINWMMEVSFEFTLHRDVFHLSINYLDRFLSLTENIDRNCLQLIAITALFIAAKLEEVYPPKVKSFASICDGACTVEDILRVELQMMEILKWDLVPATIPFWMNLYLQNAARWFPLQFAATQFQDLLTPPATREESSSSLAPRKRSFISSLKSHWLAGGKSSSASAAAGSSSTFSYSFGNNQTHHTTSSSSLLSNNSNNNNIFRKRSVNNNASANHNHNNNNANSNHPFPLRQQLGPLYKTSKYKAAMFLVDNSIHDIEALFFSYSVISASVFYLKCCCPSSTSTTTSSSTSSTFTSRSRSKASTFYEEAERILLLCTGYELYQLDECLDWISNFDDIPFDQSATSVVPDYLLQRVDPHEHHHIQVHSSSIIQYMNRLYEADKQSGVKAN